MRFMQDFRFNETYDTEDLDLGREDNSSCLVVNTAGVYFLDEDDDFEAGSIERANGRYDYLLCYLAKGKMQVYLNGKPHSFNKGFFILPPGVPHKYDYLGNTGEFSLLWCHFTGYGAASILKECGMECQRIYSTKDMGEIGLLFETLIKELHYKALGYEEITAAIFHYILALAARQAAPSIQNRTAFADSRMQTALDYIYLYYARHITLKELAGLVGLSVSRFSKLFTDNFAISPIQYIIEYRVQRACDLLRHTNYSISAVAKYVGFDDELYFSRIFKKKMKKSPSEYRRQESCGMILPNDSHKV